MRGAEVEKVLEDNPYVVADNVVPRIGVLAPESARAAIREMFLSHVIGGKHLSKRADFTAMVTGATPDVVLTGVELLARGWGRSGRAPATWSSSTWAAPPPTSTRWSSSTPRRRTSRARSSRRRPSPVPSRATSACAGRPPRPLPPRGCGLDDLAAAADVRHADPGFLPSTDADYADDERIAAAAVGLALRRHAGRSQVVVGPDGRVVERTGKDLREVDLLVASGGVLRHGRPGVEQRVFAGSTGEVEGGWQLPVRPRFVVDRDYVLAAAGLLAARHPEAAYRLVQRLAEDSLDAPPARGTPRREAGPSLTAWATALTRHVRTRPSSPRPRRTTTAPGSG